MLGEPARHLRARAPFLRQLGELRGAHLHDCEFGRDEKSVRQDQEKCEN
jgi:hypothetical protein